MAGANREGIDQIAMAIEAGALTAARRGLLPLLAAHDDPAAQLAAALIEAMAAQAVAATDEALAAAFDRLASLAETQAAQIAALLALVDAP